MNFVSMRSIILISFIFSSFISSAQAINKSFIGTWINYKLNEKMKANQPFDSLAKIFPQFITIKNYKKIEVQNRFEQKEEYIIQGKKDNILTTSEMRLVLDADTIKMYDNYNDKWKFVKYKNK